MSMTDPIADMLTRIRNGASANKLYVNVPYSNVKNNILEVLKEEGFIEGFEKNTDGKFPVLKVNMKYHNGNPVIKKIKRVSKPGRRIYSKISELKSSLGGLGTFIISSPDGIISDSKARAAKVGGEIICEVY